MNDLLPKGELLNQPLEQFFLWSEKEWEDATQGTALTRAGYDGWLRNIAVALGNARTTERIVDALKSRNNRQSQMVNEHIYWALEQHQKKSNQ
jgi:epoxyqueuosine reductase